MILTESFSTKHVRDTTGRAYDNLSALLQLVHVLFDIRTAYACVTRRLHKVA